MITWQASSLYDSNYFILINSNPILQITASLHSVLPQVPAQHFFSVSKIQNSKYRPKDLSNFTSKLIKHIFSVKFLFREHKSCARHMPAHIVFVASMFMYLIRRFTVSVISPHQCSGCAVFFPCDLSFIRAMCLTPQYHKNSSATCVLH